MLDIRTTNKKRVSVQHASGFSGILHNIFFFIFSALILSPIGANYLLVFGGNYYPEPAVFVFSILAWFIFPRFPDFILSIILGRLFLLTAFACFAATLLGIILNGITILDGYAISRGILTFAIGAQLVAIANNIPKDKVNFIFERIRIISFFTILNSIFYFAFLKTNYSPKNAYSVTAMLVCIYLFTLTSRSSFKYVLFLICIYGSISSSFRAYIAYVFIALSAFVFSEFMSIFQFHAGRISFRPRRVAQFGGFVAGVFFFAPFILASAVSYIQADESRYHQIVYKFEQQYQDVQYGSFDGDTDPRFEMYKFFIENIDGYLIPGGFIDRQNFSMRSPWLSQEVFFSGSSPFRDSGFLVLCISFGFIFVFPLICIFIYKFMNSIFRRQSSEIFVRLAYLFCCVSLFLTTGGIFLVMDTSFYFGILLALLVLPRDVIGRERLPNAMLSSAQSRKIAV